MLTKILVTGANGHLGNNLIRSLLKNGNKVRASVRDTKNMKPFDELKCELVYADILDFDSLVEALDGIETVYHTAAVFKHWAANPIKEIINPNAEGTNNLFNAAKICGVNKIIYTSSIVALDYNKPPLSPDTWNSNYINPYNQSKTESEKTAWKLAEELDIETIAVLPSAIIGGHSYGHLTPTMIMLKSIMENQMTFDINFTLNYIDVEDVAAGMIAAAIKGKPGQRYILGNKKPINTCKLFEIAKDLFPEVKTPPVISKEQLMQFAINSYEQSKRTGGAPALLPYLVESSYEADVRLDISKSEQELGFNPLSPEEAIRNAFVYLKNRGT
ncbi:MAG: NAD-dependent epimerase/dehydratase family protein [Gammaproteobacteria bacterium]|nr:MAG: NAD-dependent epimerase/dehydratase family protein [Gammaproteobacteria bacterium]